MDLGLKGRKAIVCASSKGLGRGCAEVLAAAGCDIVVNGRDPHTLGVTAAAIREQYGVTVTEIVGDVSTAEVQAALLAACPKPDILINNNAGPKFRDFRDLDRAAIMAALHQNLVTPFELIRAVIDGMAERRFGRIVNITSLGVYQPIAGLDLSAAARAGLTAFVSGIGRGVIGKNVTINNLLPGKFDTDRIREGIRFGAEKAGMSFEEQAQKQAAEIPAGRLGTVEEFGHACAFLCSAQSGYITGQNLILDGGYFNTSF